MQNKFIVDILILNKRNDILVNVFKYVYMEYQIKTYICVFSNKPNGGMYAVILANNLVCVCLCLWHGYVPKFIHDEQVLCENMLQIIGTYDLIMCMI